MGKSSFTDFIIRNRYVILFVSIVLILVFTGIIRALLEVIFTVLLILLAIYLGKRIQEDNDYLKRKFQKGKEKIEYTVKDDDGKGEKK